MNEPQNQTILREKLAEILQLLRQEKENTREGTKAHAIAVAITQLEIASMCIIRSFFADEEYSPLNRLKPADD